ncbi:MAG: choice-of-anchor L domain-containing protein, partial [Chitinophagales bacterium]
MFFSLIIISLSSKGQITWTTGYTADEMAATLAGTGTEIDNAVIDCYSLAFGKFDGTDSNVGLDSGIILTSGKVLNIAGPNNSGSTSFDNVWPGDPDLELLGAGTQDACSLEFDVYSPGDTLQFSYVFGSDEYPEYANTAFNDAFAFFISGPGFGTLTNIALIPGTAVPVSINNINATDYPAYYIPNGTGGVGIWGTDPYYVEYDGLLVELVALAVVTPCEWYHLKLVIADRTDGSWDSGVFLKAGSLITNVAADFTFPGAPFGLLAEFCSTDADPVPVFGADATPGVFTASPTGLIFDNMTGVIDLDASTPGSYDYTNTVINPGCYGDTDVYTITVVIDVPPIATFNYPGTPFCSDEFDPSPFLAFGATAGTFSAAPAGLVVDPVTGIIDISASAPGSYIVSNLVLSGTACPDVTATTMVTINPVFAVSVVDETCSGTAYTLPDGTNVFATGTYVTILNTVDGCDSTITTDLTVNPAYAYTLNPSICLGTTYTLPDGTIVNTTGTYFNPFLTTAGCDSTYTINLSVDPAPVINPTIHLCDGETYVLPDGAVVGVTGLYPVTLITAAGCDSTINTTVLVHPVYDIFVDAEICDDAVYVLPDGTTANVTGAYVTNFLTTKGCDSIITTNLIAHPTYNTILNPEICIGATYVLPDGTSSAVSGTWNFPFISYYGCDSLVTVNLIVHPLPVLSWVIDDIFCVEEGAIQLEADPAGGTYGGPGVSGDNFITSLAGVGGPYTLTYDYTDPYGCSSSTTIETSVDDNYATAWGDTTVYYGEDAVLFSDAGGDYTWSPTDGIECISCPISNVLPPYTIDYIITSVDENGCIATDNALVTVLPDPGNILYVPNTFTPNGDNINDIFFVFGYNLVLINKIEVYDRWGELL